MKEIPYASLIGNLMYAQVCTKYYIAYAVNALGRFRSNLGINHIRAAKKVMRYLQRTKDFMHVYSNSDDLDIVGMPIFILRVAWMTLCLKWLASDFMELC